MPWNEATRAVQRLRLVLAILRHLEPVAAICRRCGVSRQTAYKCLRRFAQGGRKGLEDHFRGVARSGRAGRWRRCVLGLRTKRPTWGARKLRWRLRQLHPHCRLPSERTVERWLHLAGLARRVVRKRHPAALWRAAVQGHRPNDVWTVDFKGWFRTAAGERIEPLTVRDLQSRYLLCVTPVASTSEAHARAIFVRLFKQYGLPRAIRTDQGTPFCSTGPYGLTKLSVWWYRLGIRVEFVDRRNHIDNNAHEQMHRILQQEVARFPAPSRAAQTKRLIAWQRHYNYCRPHEALGQQTPASRYRPSKRPLFPLHPLQYPAGWLVRLVKAKGEISAYGHRYGIGRAFRGLAVGLRPITANLHHVYLGTLPLGILDLNSLQNLVAFPQSNTGGGGSKAPSLHPPHSILVIPNPGKVSAT